jgi:hypothetical protein
VTFVKGQSGNPGGMPKGTAELKALAREHAPEAIATLANIMRDVGAQSSARVAAANSLLDRGYGKPVQEVSGPDGVPLLGDITIRLVKAEPEAPPEPGAWS